MSRRTKFQGEWSLTFTHSFMPAHTREERCDHFRLDIDGPGADDVGPTIGPGIAETFRGHRLAR